MRPQANKVLRLISNTKAGDGMRRRNSSPPSAPRGLICPGSDLKRQPQIGSIAFYVAISVATRFFRDAADANSLTASESETLCERDVSGGVPALLENEVA
jgi:hypothetical protein